VVLVWRAGEWLVRAASFAIACFALVSHALLLLDRGLSPWLAPASLGVGAVLASVLRSRPSFEAETVRVPRRQRWLLAGLGVALVIALAAVVWGSTTLPRIFDGFAAWEPRARALAPPTDPSLLRPDPALYAHSQRYPLLQPLLLGSAFAWLGEAGRPLFFPCLYLLLVALCGLTLRRQGIGRSSWLYAAALALTPMWLNEGSGAVDSGYAELFVAVALTMAAAGLLLEDAALTAAGALILPLLKPEGLPYAALLCLVTALVATPWRLHLSALLAVVAGSSLRLALAAGAARQDAAPSLLAVVGVAVALLALRWAWRRCSGRVGRGLVAGAALAGAIALLVALRHGAFAGQDDLAHTLAGGGDWARHLRQLPAALLGAAGKLVSVRHYGLLPPLLLLLPLACRLPAPGKRLAVWGITGLGLAMGTLLLVEPGSLAHEVRSRFDRLLLQWVGVGWLLAGAWLGRLTLVEPSPPAGEAVSR
jgi:hypothetical protein